MNPNSQVKLAAALAGMVAPLSAQLPAGAGLVMESAAPGSSVVLRLEDPGNHTWVVQESTDLKDWKNVLTGKVHNGHYRYSIPSTAGASGGYYRTLYDAVRQTGQSTLEDALNLPAISFNYANPLLPPHLLTPLIAGQNNTPVTNPTTNPGAELGRVLFYDKRLSLNQAVSCSSCHQPEHGFSDPKPFSEGFAGGLTGRNSMGLTSARYYGRGHFFWDERAATLEDQVLQPIQNAVEMGMTLPELVARLSAEPYYAPLFTAAFGDGAVTSNRISLALAQFVRSIISFRSRYDEGVPLNFANFTDSERLGRQIFLGQVGTATCATCHGTDNFVPNNVFNNGLENPYVDKGIGALTGLAQDEGLFKVPSLRNIALTAPYMHDGRFGTLEQVVEFYNSGVVNHPNLSPTLRNPPPQPGQPPPPPGPRRLNLTAQQKTALVDFLKTLTDTTVTTDPKFQDPFEYGP